MKALIRKGSRNRLHPVFAVLENDRDYFISIHDHKPAYQTESFVLLFDDHISYDNIVSRCSAMATLQIKDYELVELQPLTFKPRRKI